MENTNFLQPGIDIRHLNIRAEKYFSGTQETFIEYFYTWNYDW